MITKTSSGHSYPLGASLYKNGVNFSLFSKNATAIELLLFDSNRDRHPTCVIRLDPTQNRTFYYWHVFVPHIGTGQLYAYRAYGPFDPQKGHRFDASKVLVDPYARAVMVDEHYSRDAAKVPGDNVATAMKSVVVDPNTYDWEGDEPLQRSYANSVIYEMHVGGFTRHSSSGEGEDNSGTYAALIPKIPYLQSLGITAVELLPVQQFDEQEAPRSLQNYWGYAPIALFAPHRGYASAKEEPLAPVNEFRDMVKALHRAGIEVILDVVFNHTAESDELGPTLSFRGLENQAYYILEGEDKALYANYAGCGNTLKCNHSIVRRMIVDCLRYWVQEMHVDGFRFDLASIMSRDEEGHPLKNPPILWEIESDPVLAGTKIIAEAWDAAGLYQVGSFVGHRWAEWNGQFRDDVRRFVKSDAGMVRKLASRITGSPDLYPEPNREAQRSINFITCHDGFTLHDLLSYNEKHNEANLENNQDGTNNNESWNCGVEGPTDEAEINALRRRQMKNLMTILFISQGTPMLLMGDEVARTQRGNNNVYCQNNELSWFDWRLVDQNADMLRFVKGLIHFHRAHALFQQRRFWTVGDHELLPRLTWHGTRLYEPDWSHESRTLAFSLHDAVSGEELHVILNAYWEALTFELPILPAPKQWHRLIDTARPSPEDFCDPETAPPVKRNDYLAEARSSVVLVAR